MCLAVYVASDADLPDIAWCEGQMLWAERATGDRRPACLAARHVLYVGAHTHCGCGFLTDGVAPEDDEYAKVHSSMAALKSYVENAAAAGPVEVFACWEGAQAEQGPEAQGVAPDHFWFEARPFDKAWDSPLRLVIHAAVR